LPPDWGVDGDDGVGIVAGRVLVEALVWAVVVEVAYVLVEDGAGVLFVVDQQPVGAFFADAADEPFCVAVGALSTWRQNRSIRILLPQPVVVSARLELLHLGGAKKK
jgi:hypothetical protein